MRRRPPSAARQPRSRAGWRGAGSGSADSWPAAACRFPPPSPLRLSPNRLSESERPLLSHGRQPSSGRPGPLARLFRNCCGARWPAGNWPPACWGLHSPAPRPSDWPSPGRLLTPRPRPPRRITTRLHRPNLPPTHSATRFRPEQWPGSARDGCVGQTTRGGSHSPRTGRRSHPTPITIWPHGTRRPAGSSLSARIMRPWPPRSVGERTGRAWRSFC
jgi:hypothetical protein